MHQYREEIPKGDSVREQLQRHKIHTMGINQSHRKIRAITYRFIYFSFLFGGMLCIKPDENVISLHQTFHFLRSL